MQLDHTEAGCCPAPVALTPENTGVEPFDATLSSCCARDAAEQRRVARAKEALLSVDRIDARIRAQKSVLKPAAPGPSTGDNLSDEDSLASDAEDPMLARFREERLRAMQLDEKRSVVQARATSASGQLQSLTEAQALDGLRMSDGNLVMHLSQHGWQVGQELDELLETLAFCSKPTAFWRVPLSRSSKLLFGLPYGPALLAYKDGSLIGKVPLVRFAPEGFLVEEQVTKWLRELGIISSTSASSHDDEDEVSEGDPCEICGRRYFHQHIPGSTLRPGSEADDSGSD